MRVKVVGKTCMHTLVALTLTCVSRSGRLQQAGAGRDAHPQPGGVAAGRGRRDALRTRLHQHAAPASTAHHVAEAVVVHYYA